VFTEPDQEQSQNTWSVAFENSFHATPDVDIVAFAARQHFRSGQLPRDLRAVQHQVRHRDAESGSLSGAGHQRQGGVESGADKSDPFRKRHLLQQRSRSDSHVVLPDTTTQTQNVGTGEFYVIELSADVDVIQSLTVGCNYTLVHREINHALQPNLRPTGVPPTRCSCTQRGAAFRSGAVPRASTQPATAGAM
jgi:hypothetical protein